MMYQKTTINNIDTATPKIKFSGYQTQIITLLFAMFFYILPTTISFAQEGAGGQDQSTPDNYFNLLDQYNAIMEEEPNDTAEDGISKNIARWQWFWEKRIGSGTENNNGDFSNYVGAVQKLLDTGPLCQNATESQLNWELLGPISQEEHRQGRVDIVLADSQNSDVVYVGTVSSGLWRCDDISAETPQWTNITDVLAMPAMGVLGFDINPDNPDIGYVSLGYNVGGLWSYRNFSVGLFKTTNLTEQQPVWEKILPEDNNDIHSKVTHVLIDKTNPQRVYAVINQKLMVSDDDGSTFYLMVDFGSGENNPGFKLRITDLIIDKYDSNVLFIVGDYTLSNTDYNRKAIFWKYNIATDNLTDQTALLNENISISPFYTAIHLDEGQYGIYALYFYYDNNIRRNTIKKTSDSGNSWVTFKNFDTANSNAVFDVSNSNENIFYIEGSNRSCETYPEVPTGYDCTNTTAFRRLLKFSDSDGSDSLIYCTNYRAYNLYHGVSTHADIRGFTIIEDSEDGLSDNILCASDGGVLHSVSAFDDHVVWKDINGEGLAITMYYGMGQRYDKANVYGGGVQDNGTLIFQEDGKWDHPIGGDGWELLFDKNNSSFALSSNGFGNNFFHSSNYAQSFTSTLFTDQNQSCRKNALHQPVYNDRSGHTFIAFHDIYLSNEHGSSGSWSPISDFSNSGFSNSDLDVPENWLVESLIAYPGDNNIVYAAFASPTWDRDMLAWNGDCKDDINNPGPGDDGCGGCTLYKRLFKTEDALSGNPIWTDITPSFEAGPNPPSNAIRWRGITDLAISDSNPDDIYASFDQLGSDAGDITKGITRVTASHDGGASWVDYSDGLPAFPVTRLVYYNGSHNGLFAGTDLGVYYTDNDIYPDNGWICVSNGFPPAFVTDIDINYCREVIRVSTFGHGMWEADLKQLGVETDMIVDQDATWDTPRDITGNITVTNGADLLISSSIYMSANKFITIEKGSKLTIDGGTITNACGNFWGGIFVQGDKTLRQSPSSNMGQLIVKNEGTIEYASTAVRNYALNENGDTDWISTGGIIKTYSGAQFLNNKRDAEFLSYQNYAGTSPINDKSYFQETSFAVTELLPNDQKPLDRITMYQVDGIKIKACDFSSSTEYVMGLRGDGIYAIDASFVVESYQDNPSTFTNLAKGIEVENYNDYYTISVNKAQFNDLPAGIFMLDVMEASITENQFSIFTSSTFKSPYGLYMVGCSGYKVEENVFTGEAITGSTPLGIVVKNKNLEADNDLYRNEFFNLHSGILVMGKNSNESFSKPTGLEILCNRFYNLLLNYSDFALTNSGSVSFQQGKDDGKTTGPAGNIFSAMACNKENSLFVSDDSFYYAYNHHSNAEATPGPGCYTADHVLLNNTSQGYTNWATDACPSKLGSDDEIELPDNKLAVEGSKAELVVLKAEYETVVDGGGSTDLLAMVENPLNSSYTVRSELKSASPYLSDEVLDAAIMRNPALNAWHMAEIMMANAPVSPMVWGTFEQNTTMPNFLFNYVYYYQQNGGTSSRAELEMQMKTQVDIKEKASSDYVRGQMIKEDNTDKNQKILELYALDNDNLAIRRKVAALTSAGAFADAQELLSAYNENPEVDAYTTVQDIVITMHETGNNPTAGEINNLYEIANGEKFGKYKAQAILAYVDGAEFDHPIILPDPNQKSGTAGKKGRRPVEIVPILASYPNPGDKLMHFTFQLPAELNSAIIEVYNIDGRLVEQLDVSAGIGIFEFNTTDLKAGTYISSLLVNGDKVATHKFQVQH